MMKNRLAALTLAFIMALSLLPAARAVDTDEIPEDIVSAPGGYAALQSAPETHYDTVIAALAECAEEDVLIIAGRVRWGGASETEYPGRAVTITGADESASIVMNGADGRTLDGPAGDPVDESPNVTEFPCDITFRSVSLETSMGINFFFANGYRLAIDEDVNIAANGSVCSNELSGSYLIAVGGSWSHSVDGAEMILNAGAYELVIGGGMGQDVTGDVSVSLGQAAVAGDLVGGGYRGDVGGSTLVSVDTAADHVVGGGYQGHVEGAAAVSINGSVSSVSGGSWNTGHVGGDASVTVAHGAEVTNGPVYGGCDDDANALMGEGDNSRYSLKENEQIMYPGARDIGAGESYVGGNTAVTVDGVVSSGVYGGGDYPVRGNTSVTIGGTVGTEPDWYTGVYGSGGKGGSVDGNTYVEITERGKVLRENNSLGVCGGVVGGGYGGTVYGDTMVVIDGTVGNDELGGTVFGGGARGGDVLGTANVVVNRPVADAAEQADDWFGFGVYGLGIGRICGVYGGTFNGVMSGDTNVVVNVDMELAPVYGGSVIGNVDGDANVTLNDGAGANFIMAGGGFACPMGYQEDGTGLVGGDATVTLKGGAAAGTIRGYETKEGLARSIDGAARVVFDGNTGAVKQVHSADLVWVTNSADVVIDNEGRDNEQLVNVADLTIDKGGKLRLPANAHILGGYTGADEERGTLAVSAGKTLTVDGTVTGRTDISIVDSETAKPAEAQVYVVSGAGSTTGDGDYSWIDRRTGLAMEWRANEGGNSQWWLVKYDEPVDPPVNPGTTYYHVTVNYLRAENGGKLADSVTRRIRSGSAYDVGVEAAKMIEGYVIDHVDGATSGTLRSNVTVDVYYTEETDIEDPYVPTADKPELPGDEVELEDMVPPLTDLPGDRPEDGESVIIVDEEIPLGDLPQTGAVAAQTDPAVTLGAAALSLSLALAGAAVVLIRRKREAE